MEFNTEINYNHAYAVNVQHFCNVLKIGNMVMVQKLLRLCLRLYGSEICTVGNYTHE
jgi:hypothetical protein